MSPIPTPIPSRRTQQTAWHIRTVPDAVLWRPLFTFALVATAVAALAWIIHKGTIHYFMDEAMRQGMNEIIQRPSVLGFIQDMAMVFPGTLAGGTLGFLPLAMLSLYYARRKRSLARSAWAPGLVVAGSYLVVMLVSLAVNGPGHHVHHIGLAVRNIVLWLMYPTALLAGTWSLHREFRHSQEAPEVRPLYRRCPPKLIVMPYGAFALVQSMLLVLVCAPPLISEYGRAQVMPLAMMAYCLLYSSVLYLPLSWYSLHRAQRTRSIAKAVWPPALGVVLVYALIITDDYWHLAHSTGEPYQPIVLRPDYVAYCGLDLTIIAPMLALIPATFLLHYIISRRAEPVAAATPHPDAP